ncbi:MAG: carbon monoxide dehydrogenase subunit G [Acidobacteria bacterium]|nr:carbon monoxide dehydrogenase subunit G [Acidobacteriota bacterium]
MKIEGERHFNVPRERLFEALLDPEILARTLPGCEKLERTGDDRFRGVLNIAIGPVKGKFQGSLELSDVDPPNGYHMVVKGQGPSGFMKGEGDLSLAEADGGTILTYVIDAQVGGRMAAVGQRLMESSAKVVSQQGLDGLAAQVEAPPAGAVVEGEAPAAPAPPSQAKMAVGFAGGLWKEMIPAPARRLLAILGWVLLGLGFGWWLRGFAG